MADVIDPNRIPGLAEVDELLLAQERTRHRLACDAAALIERAAIVADLRREAAELHRLGHVYGRISAQDLERCADRIERGEHHRQRGGEGGDGRG